VRVCPSIPAIAALIAALDASASAWVFHSLPFMSLNFGGGGGGGGASVPPLSPMLPPCSR